MSNRLFLPPSPPRKQTIKVLFFQMVKKMTYLSVFLFGIVVTIGLVALLESKTIIFQNVTELYTATSTEPFPVSVDLYNQEIEEAMDIDEEFAKALAQSPGSTHHWWNQVAAVFASHEWYQQLASPVGRIAVIWPGERKEEAIKNIGDTLHWNQEERAHFTQLMDSSEPILSEGKYFPGQYVVDSGATPEDMQNLIYQSFQKEVLSRYTTEVSSRVPLETTLIIASLIEREARNDLTNMREISGVIWNRLFAEMPLQLDATLQYVKGSKPYVSSWWPKVISTDKFIPSPYNTYQNEGLPPTPIANPSVESILAALNPIKTDCFYYFHTRDGGYHCSVDYDGHVAKLRALYGRGS